MTELHEKVVAYLQADFDVAAIGMESILRVAIFDEERAFDLHFLHLREFLAAYPEIWRNPQGFVVPDDYVPIPVRGYLGALTDRPALFLHCVEPGCLRAFLDGVRVSRLDKCADFDGFDDWVRRRLRLKGVFHWDKAVIMQFSGEPESGVKWALNELKAHR
ncbi:hypothetical protein [Granulicella rosea]|uniref:hypothetical protein n=1 Tax=Granulicella rosea TaxID=474952 RepID=UPI00115EC5A6|nr:hypothetical protein [Granulicella rosea]